MSLCSEFPVQVPNQKNAHVFLHCWDGSTFSSLFCRDVNLTYRLDSLPSSSLRRISPNSHALQVDYVGPLSVRARLAGGGPAGGLRVCINFGATSWNTEASCNNLCHPSVTWTSSSLRMMMQMHRACRSATCGPNRATFSSQSLTLSLVNLLEISDLQSSLRPDTSYFEPAIRCLHIPSQSSVRALKRRSVEGGVFGWRLRREDRPMRIEIS